MIPQQKNQWEPGPNIIRAWFDTVVNPLIRALNVEEKCLDRKDWTWNPFRGVLESILPIERHLDDEILPNVHQFFSFYPDLRELVDRHDDLVNMLSRSCGILQELLQTNAALHHLYAEAVSSESLKKLGTDAQEAFSASSSEKERYAILAEHIINNRGLLPDYYVGAVLWNAWNDRFLALQREPSVAIEYDALVDIGERLHLCVRELRSSLENRRDKLSTENDVPIVASIINQAA